MDEILTRTGVVKAYRVEEAQEEFTPLRDRVFDTTFGGVHALNGRIFRDESWLQVFIRDGLFSDRTDAPEEIWTQDEYFLAWVKDDFRDPLLPLFEILVEDGILEIIHMFPRCSPEFAGDAITTAPTRGAINCNSTIRLDWFSCAGFDTRLLFDQTGRWGFYSDDDDLGILGGERELMERYIEHAGGMKFIRQKADIYFRESYDEWVTPTVPHLYKLFGWDNPPKRDGETSK